MKVTKDKLSPQNAKYLISSYKNKLIFPDELLSKANNAQEKLFAEFYKKYQNSLFDNNAADFDDLLLLPLKLFKENPAILNKYQNLWKYVLVDEYQDTNKPQFEFIQYLTKEHKQVCVVGDDDQSIYGWRGADIRNILDFERVFKGCDIFKLEKNYRSTANILDAAYSVVRNNEERAPKELISDNKNGEKLGILETNDEMEEADALINALEKEKFLFKVNKNSIYENIIANPEKKFFNPEYTNTLKTISKNFSDFYNGTIAKKIIKTVNQSINPGFFDISDFESYEAKKQKAFCYKLVNGLTLCGPNLPSSGTICLIQAFIIYENILKKSQTVSLDETLSILNFIYYL